MSIIKKKYEKSNQELLYLPDTNTLVNPTKRFKDHQSSMINKFIVATDEEEIVRENCLAFLKFLLGSVKIKVHMKTFNEFSNGILVRIRFLKIIKSNLDIFQGKYGLVN